MKLGFPKVEDRMNIGDGNPTPQNPIDSNRESRQVLDSRGCP